MHELTTPHKIPTAMAWGIDSPQGYREPAYAHRVLGCLADRFLMLGYATIYIIIEVVA